MKRDFDLIASSVTMAIIIGLVIVFSWAIFSAKTQNYQASSSLGTITAHVGPADIYPLVPGVTNPDITQGNIDQTICNSHWSTSSIRPSVSYTNALKIKQIAQYGYADTNPKDYEEDHIISLELGGNSTDQNNLWPEPYNPTLPTGGAKNKDSVENYLHKQVCNGATTLKEAQAAISGDWYQIYLSMHQQSKSDALGGITSFDDNDPDDN